MINQNCLPLILCYKHFTVHMFITCNFFNLNYLKYLKNILKMTIICVAENSQVKSFCQCNSWRDNVEWDEEQEMTARKKTQEQLNSALSTEKQGTKPVHTNFFMLRTILLQKINYPKIYFLFWFQLCVYNILLTNWLFCSGYLKIFELVVLHAKLDWSCLSEKGNGIKKLIEGFIIFMYL